MFDKSWDDVYSSKRMAAYPDNALIRFVAKYYYDVHNRIHVKFLDIGCGAGSSTWYLAREGFDVSSIDGSQAAINKLNERLKRENLQASVNCIDVGGLDFLENHFDCVVDISSLCYVPKIIKVINVHKMLKPGGRIFSICPTDTCAKEPFQLDRNFECRFESEAEVRSDLALFKNVTIYPYTYVVSGPKTVNLWVCTGEK
jgi:2-polyprenyl-3-methyl-5-hydroxy-6-metoxy-1,4-benzoquinol methylase